MAETVEQAALRLFAAEIKQGYVLRPLHAYVNEDGQPIYWRARLEHADGNAAPKGHKVIRPLVMNGCGYRFGEPDFPPGKKPIYKLDQIAAADANTPVFVVEGEKAADALVERGVIATTSGGVSSARAADWSSLTGRTCILWPDNDDAGREYMGDVAALLEALGCELAAVDIDKLNLPAKGDAYDWLADHLEATPSDLLALPRVSRTSWQGERASGRFWTLRAHAVGADDAQVPRAGADPRTVAVIAKPHHDPCMARDR